MSGGAERTCKFKWSMTTPLFAFALLAAFVFAAGVATAAPDTGQQLFKEVESELMCADNCGMHLPTCDNQTALEMRSQIREQLFLLLLGQK